MKIKKSKQEQYIPLEDIEKIDTAFLDEIERVKTRLTGIADVDLNKTFYGTLIKAYNAKIELQTFEREVDYDIKFAEIKERRRNIRPWRRGWWWRLLLFFPLTNRAQDIIEERAALNADIVHTAEEKAIEEDRKKLPQDEDKKLSKRELKRRMREKLKAIIKEADKADLKEAFEEPQAAQERMGGMEQGEAVQKPAGKPAQAQEQMQLSGVNLEQIRRARPPRGMRKR